MLQISVEFSREVSNLSKLIFRSIPIEIYLLELKMRRKYAKRYFFLKTIRFDLSSDEISFRVNDKFVPKLNANYG